MNSYLLKLLFDSFFLIDVMRLRTEIFKLYYDV